MARSHPTLMNLLIIGSFVCCVNSIKLLTYCKDHVDIATCATTHLDTTLSIYDIFDTMTTNVSSLEEMCEDQSKELHPCLGPCLLEFRTSSFSYLDNVCSFLMWIGLEQECWTEQWVLEAKECYRQLYPRHRTENPHQGLYPIPYRVYDRASIANLCFPTAATSTDNSDKCAFYQTWIFKMLLPHYYELHGYPEGFEHISDTVDFPGV